MGDGREVRVKLLCLRFYALRGVGNEILSFISSSTKILTTPLHLHLPLHLVLSHNSFTNTISLPKAKDPLTYA
jgi:hypothetical protein